MQHASSIALQDATLAKPDVRQLYVAHARAVRALACRLLGTEGDIDDLVHDVFLVACRKCAGLTRQTAFSFLLGTTVKLAATRRRRARIRRFLGLEKLRALADWQTPERMAEQHEAHRIAHQILERVPEKRRVVFIMREMQGMTGDEIAAALRCPVDTVWSRFYKARSEFLAGIRELRRAGHLPLEEDVL